MAFGSNRFKKGKKTVVKTKGKAKGKVKTVPVKTVKVKPEAPKVAAPFNDDLPISASIAQEFPGDIPADIPQVDDNESLKMMDLDVHIFRLAKVQREMARLEKEAEEYKEQIQSLMEAAEVDRIAAGTLRVSLSKPTTTYRLDRKRLFDAGVSEEQLEKGSVEVVRSGYIRVERPEQRVQRVANGGRA